MITLTRRKLLLGTAVATTVAPLLAACTPPGQGPASNTLTIYSNSLSSGRGDWLQNQAAAQGFSLQLVELGGGDVANRLTAERANPIADVVFGLNNVFFQNLKSAEVLQPYTPKWSTEVDAGIGDDAQFWPIVREPIMMVYNTAAYPDRRRAPSDWVDLWTKGEYAQRYEVPTDLGGATNQIVLVSILSRYLDPAGELGVSPAGWEAIGTFFEKGTPAVADTELYARLASRELDLGAIWLAGKVAREKQYGIQTEPIYPEVGVPMVVQHVAKVAGTSRSEEADRFIDWFGGAEVQAGWSREFFTAPTNSSAIADADADAIKQTDAFTTQEIDWPLVATNLSSWVEKIELDVLG